MDVNLKTLSYNTFVVSTVPVRFEEKPIDRHVTPGNLQITCSAFGIPAPRLRWLDINGTEVLRIVKTGFKLSNAKNHKIQANFIEYIFVYFDQ